MAHEGGLGGGVAARPRPLVSAGPDKEGEGARVGAAAGPTWNQSGTVSSQPGTAAGPRLLKAGA